MASSQEISQALKRVHQVTKKKGAPIVQSQQIEREDRELLLRTRWLEEIIKGWYLVIRPDVQPNDATLWYANFWDFLRLYLEHHYGKNYCLSAENSIELLLGESITPNQVVVMTKQGGGFTQSLPFETSVTVYQSKDAFPSEITEVHGLQVMTLPYAVCKITPQYFQKKPIEAQVALQSIQNPQDLIEIIVKYEFQRPAARLLAAYKHLGVEGMAHAIETILSDSGIRLSEDNPFESISYAITPSRIPSPYYARVITLWNMLREQVISLFPEPVIVEHQYPKIDELYVQDAYNSLSIEGYVVDEALIEQVQRGSWDPENYVDDQNKRNVLAARGYYEAHLEVKKTLNSIKKGKNPGAAIADDLLKWHLALFNPAVQAGIIEKKDLFGYRKGPVYIRNSRHVPPPREALLDAMDALFTCLRQETHPAVKAVLGHYIFVYIHPYFDGNGRLGRLLMNTLFVSGGYPWTIIQMKNRKEYMQALERVDLYHDIVPLTTLIAKSQRV